MGDRREGSLDKQRLLQGKCEAESIPNMYPEGTPPDFGFSVLNREGLLYEPVFDQSHVDSGGARPIWPGDHEFAVCLTHDVDHVTSHSVRQDLRGLSTRMSRYDSPIGTLKSFSSALLRAARSLTHSGPDPLHCYEQWLELEESVGAKSTFFFVPDHTRDPHWTDQHYRYSDPVVFDGNSYAVSDMMREIDDRGWEIGLHPTWNTYNDADELAYQKGQIEDVLGHEITSVRQHVLHHSIEQTPRIHAKAGFEVDSTLGFNHNVGFRFGTSYPWNLYDLERESELPVLEIPLVVQDVALLGQGMGLRVDTETALTYIKQLVRSVKAVGGVFTLLWHPSYIRDESWRDLYRETLDYLNEQNAWFATMADVGDWWRRKNRDVQHSTT